MNCPAFALVWIACTSLIAGGNDSHRSGAASKARTVERHLADDQLPRSVMVTSHGDAAVPVPVTFTLSPPQSFQRCLHLGCRGVECDGTRQTRPWKRQLERAASGCGPYGLHVTVGSAALVLGRHKTCPPTTRVLLAGSMNICGTSCNPGVRKVTRHGSALRPVPVTSTEMPPRFSSADFTCAAVALYEMAAVV